MIPRVVQPELLDELPPGDSRAIRSRRDLRRINSFMGNARHISAQLRQIEPPRRVLELGAGDGTLLLKIARALPAPVELHLLDMQPVVSSETLEHFRALGWKVRIISSRFENWIPREPYDLVIANLFLHHFLDEQLRSLFARLAPMTRAFISCDPRRWAPALLCTRLLWLLACNHVTRNDACISVRAGFRDQELTRLWPAGFVLREGPAGFASHLFVARKSP